MIHQDKGTPIEHTWPVNQEEHVFGPWMPKNRSTLYRTCVHPQCVETEEKPAGTLSTAKEATT
jgi:hypothetical protein